MRFQFVAMVLAMVALGFEAAADDAAAVIPHRQDRVPNKPFAAEQAARRMTVPDGFHVDLVASEPQIVNPIAMCFDDRGRIWITESVEYPRKSAGPGRDRVKLIEGLEIGRAHV